MNIEYKEIRGNHRRQKESQFLEEKSHWNY